MLVINRTNETLTPDERHISTLSVFAPRTVPRPTDQRSGELKGASLKAFASETIADTENQGDQHTDIPFSYVSDDAPLLPPAAPYPTPTLCYPPHTKGTPTMQFKHFQRGACLIQAYPTDMAVLALVLRHAASNEDLQELTPIMPTTLDSLATAFELGTILGLQQMGHPALQDETSLTAEQVQAWCQRVIQEGVDVQGTPTYTIDPTATTADDTAQEQG